MVVFGDRESQVLQFKREWLSFLDLWKCQIRFRGDIKFEIDSATSFKKTINDAQNTSSTKLSFLPTGGSPNSAKMATE